MNKKEAFYNSDIKIIEKLNKLNNPKTFYSDVRSLARNVHSDFQIKRWQHLADIRYAELCGITHPTEED